MGCIIEDARGGLIALALAEDGEDGAWCFPSDDCPAVGWFVCAGDPGCHVTVIDGPFGSENDAHTAIAMPRSLGACSAGQRGSCGKCSGLGALPVGSGHLRCDVCGGDGGA